MSPRKSNTHVNNNPPIPPSPPPPQYDHVVFQASVTAVVVAATVQINASGSRGAGRGISGVRFTCHRYQNTTSENRRKAKVSLYILAGRIDIGKP
ncbi:hypothetical protein Lser_V15G03694 [Lactuca serriola]